MNQKKSTFTILFQYFCQCSTTLPSLSDIFSLSLLGKMSFKAETPTRSISKIVKIRSYILRNSYDSIRTMNPLPLIVKFPCMATPTRFPSRGNICKNPFSTSIVSKSTTSLRRLTEIMSGEITPILWSISMLRSMNTKTNSSLWSYGTIGTF